MRCVPYIYKVIGNDNITPKKQNTIKKIFNKSKSLNAKYLDYNILIIKYITMTTNTPKHLNCKTNV